MLNNKNRKYLKSLANTCHNRYQIGKEEITKTSIDLLDKALTAYELIKIDVLNTVKSSISEISLDLSSKLNAEIVQIIGKVIVLYRKNEKSPKIKF